MRLKYLIGLNDRTRILENLGAILAWASVEVNVGMLVANLPACRPVLEQLIRRFSSRTGSASHTLSGGRSGGHTTRKSRLDDNTSEQYVLEERPRSVTLQDFLRYGHNTGKVGLQTRIYSDLDEESSNTMDHLDNGSQKNIVQRVSEDDRFRVNIHRDFKMEVCQEGSNSRTAG